MPANIFKIEGERVDSIDDFNRLKKGDGWSNVLYYPNDFGPSGHAPFVFTKKKFQEVSFKDTDINNVRFIRCTFERCLFLGTSIRHCEFVDCDFVSTNTSKIRFSNTLIDPADFQNNFDLVEDTNIAIHLFQALYKNSMDEHQPEFAVESLFQMKNAERSHLQSQWRRGVITRLEYWWRASKYGLHSFISGYGLRPARVVRLASIVIGAMTLFNYAIRHHVFPENSVSTLIDSLYFTCITVTTLGYGDLVPTTQLGRVIIVMEALAGFGTVSLLLAAVINLALRAR